jgi:hypothetical protein
MPAGLDHRGKVGGKRRGIGGKQGGKKRRTAARQGLGSTPRTAEAPTRRVRCRCWALVSALFSPCLGACERPVAGQERGAQGPPAARRTFTTPPALCGRQATRIALPPETAVWRVCLGLGPPGEGPQTVASFDYVRPRGFWSTDRRDSLDCARGLGCCKAALVLRGSPAICPADQQGHTDTVSPLIVRMLCGAFATGPGRLCLPKMLGRRKSMR